VLEVLRSRNRLAGEVKRAHSGEDTNLGSHRDPGSGPARYAALHDMHSSSAGMLHLPLRDSIYLFNNAETAST